MQTAGQIRWQDLGTARADSAGGNAVELTGFPVCAPATASASSFLLVPEPACCPGCAPRNRSAVVEVSSRAPVPMRSGALRLRGEWHVRHDSAEDWRYRLTAAELVEPPGWRGLTRRGVLAAGPLICLAAGARPAGAAEARAVIEAVPAIDMHSHAGGIASVSRIGAGVGFSPIAMPMRVGGMAVACLAIVSDGPTHHVVNGYIRPYRDPAPGELSAYAERAFSRLAELIHSEGLRLVASRADMAAARAGVPSAIVSAEGADFLEGSLERLDEAYARWTLRHLQLTHYRVNELGDIQTELPVHNGLTEFGAAVVRHCNRLGIVVDLAHATMPMVQRAAEVTAKPLVLSHTSLIIGPSRFSRRITAEHARLIAGTGGVVGIWPPRSEFPTMAALAAGMARMVDAVGIDHVGLGSDIRGLVGTSMFPDYDQLPALAEALLDAGFRNEDVGKVLGGNYARVMGAALSG